MTHNVVEPLADSCQLHGIEHRTTVQATVTIADLDCNSTADRRDYAMFSRNMEGILSAIHSRTPGFQINNSGIVPFTSGQLSDDQPSNQANSFLQDGREGPSRDHHATFGLKVKIA